MNGLFALFDFDTMASAVIQSSGPAVGQALASQTWALQGGTAGVGAPPFDATWMFWTLGVIEEPGSPPSEANPLICGVAQAPWNYGTVTCYYVSNFGMSGIELPDGSFTSCTYICYSNCQPTSVSIAAPSTMSIAAPANLTTFLATLPAASVDARAPSRPEMIHQRVPQ
jgi:hypothetical protein